MSHIRGVADIIGGLCQISYATNAKILVGYLRKSNRRPRAPKLVFIPTRPQAICLCLHTYIYVFI